MSADPAPVAEARDLVAELVDIPSPSGSEGRIVDRIEELCGELVDAARRVRSELGRDSLVLGRAEDPALAFVAHVDTIAAPWPGERRVEGDVVHGLGSVDDKGGVVACLLAARDLVAAGEDLDALAVAFAFPVDEERGGSGSRTVALELAPRRAIALEATGLRVGTVETGDIDAWVHVRGRSAHGALTDVGENAIHARGRADLRAADARTSTRTPIRCSGLAGGGRCDQGRHRVQHGPRLLQLPAADPDRARGRTATPRSRRSRRSPPSTRRRSRSSR